MDEIRVAKDDMLRVIDIETFLVPDNPSIPVMSLRLENGEDFYLYNIPYDIVEVINRIREDRFISPSEERASIFDLLSQHDDFKNMVKEDLEYIVIDEFNPETMLFTASAYFSNGSARIVKKMIPSHAVFLAVIGDKPIFVLRSIVELEKKISED
jgi:bifunctional DNase/RNase